MERIREWTRVLTRLAAEPGVHFHRGPQGTPVPCFEDTCCRPRLPV